MALLLMSSTTLFVTTLTFLGLWIRARERAIRAGMEGKRPTEGKTPELEQLINAVDAIAVEVERISEAQRFTTKVLVERGDAAAVAKRVPAPERVITPH